MKSILVCCPNPTDSTSFYRGMGPLGRLKEELPDYNFIMTDKVSWVTLGLVDMVFMQRPSSDAHLNLAEMAVSNRKPIWVDYDDSIFQVEESNPSHVIYGRKNVKENIAKILARASVVTVSTAHIKKEFEQLNSRIVVIPNALDERRFPLTDEALLPRNPLIVWRGSATHDEDMWTYADTIGEATHNHPDHTFAFIGSPFWLAMQSCSKNNVVIVPPTDPIDYMAALVKTAPKAMMVPLKDSPFNRGKSNIAWLEAAYAGAVTIAPRWAEWDVPGVLHYSNAEEFEAAINMACSDDVRIRLKAIEARRYIKECLTLGDTNKKRADIIRLLTK